MCGATWSAVRNACFGGCLTCAAVEAAVPFAPERSAYLLREERVTKLASEKLASWAHADAVLGEGHGTGITLPDGFQDSVGLFFDGRRDMAQE